MVLATSFDQLGPNTNALVGKEIGDGIVRKCLDLAAPTVAIFHNHTPVCVGMVHEAPSQAGRRWMALVGLVNREDWRGNKIASFVVEVLCKAAFTQAFLHHTKPFLGCDLQGCLSSA